MRFYGENIEVTDRAFGLMRGLIHERTGLSYQNGRGDLLADKLTSLVIDHGFNSLLDYYYLLRYDEAERSAEWRRVYDVLSVPETFFWREVDQIHQLVNHIVPQHFSNPLAEPLQIWSVACSTGDEPLTIAMALNEAGWFDRCPIEINAGDISPAALKRARAGSYRESDFRELPPGLREKYFTKAADEWRISANLHERIKWHSLNLNEASTIAHFLRGAHVIFCRNVFIYFSEDAIRRAVGAFHRALTTPGYLFIAAAESLLKFATDFEFQQMGEAFVYVKN
jgi:chemotaxis protein methyltransferase CheR